MKVIIKVCLPIILFALSTVVIHGKTDSILNEIEPTKNKNTRKKILMVGTNTEYSPFEYKKNDEYVGIDIELVHILADKLNMKLKIVDMDFDSLIPALNARKIDIAIAALTITEEREEIIDFSIPYYSCNQVIIVPENSDININDEKDLTDYTIGVHNKTTGQIYISKNYVEQGKIKDKQIIKYPTNNETIDEILNGNIDLAIIDMSAAKANKKLKPIRIVYTIETNEKYGIAMPKDSSLKSKINNSLKEILNSEKWIDILNKYLK